MRYTKPDNTAIRFTHLHSGNSSKRRRQGKEYVTIARLVDKSSGNILSMGTAYCSERDNPSKVIGREVASGRALKNFYLKQA